MEVPVRRNKQQYNRWFKLLSGLYMVTDALCQHIGQVLDDFHTNYLLGKLGPFTCHAPNLQLVFDEADSKWSITGEPACTDHNHCTEWLDTIAAEYLGPYTQDLFTTCDLKRLNASSWEVGKIFLTSLQAKESNSPADLDLYYLMQLTTHCRLFSQPPHDIHYAVDQVLKTRNRLVHAAIHGIETDAEVKDKIDDMIQLVRLLPNAHPSTIANLEKVRDVHHTHVDTEPNKREMDCYMTLLKTDHQEGFKKLDPIQKEMFLLTVYDIWQRISHEHDKRIERGGIVIDSLEKLVEVDISQRAEEGRAKVTSEVQAAKEKVEEGSDKVTGEVQAGRQNMEAGSDKITGEVQTVMQKVELCIREIGAINKILEERIKAVTEIVSAMEEISAIDTSEDQAFGHGVVEMDVAERVDQDTEEIRRMKDANWSPEECNIADKTVEERNTWVASGGQTLRHREEKIVNDGSKMEKQMSTGKTTDRWREPKVDQRKDPAFEPSSPLSILDKGSLTNIAHILNVASNKRDRIATIAECFGYKQEWNKEEAAEVTIAKILEHGKDQSINVLWDVFTDLRVQQCASFLDETALYEDIVICHEMTLTNPQIKDKVIDLLGRVCGQPDQVLARIFDVTLPVENEDADIKQILSRARQSGGILAMANSAFECFNVEPDVYTLLRGSNADPPMCEELLRATTLEKRTTTTDWKESRSANDLPPLMKAMQNIVQHTTRFQGFVIKSFRRYERHLVVYVDVTDGDMGIDDVRRAIRDVVDMGSDSEAIRISEDAPPRITLTARPGVSTGQDIIANYTGKVGGFVEDRLHRLFALSVAHIFHDDDTSAVVKEGAKNHSSGRHWQRFCTLHSP